MQMDTNGLYDIFDLWHKPWWQHSVVFIALICLAAGAALFLLWMLIAKVRRRFAPIASMQERARRAIEDAQLRYSAESESKQLYAALSQAIKSYCAERYVVDLSGTTEHEMLAALIDNGAPVEVCSLIEPFLRTANVIKFSADTADPSTMKKDIARLLLFVEKTTPIVSKG